MPETNQPAKPSSIFFIELDKIKPNPLQPRQEFDEVKLSELAESIRQYGVLQPLVVVRTEKTLPTGVVNEYELIAGERRLRASRLAGLSDVPVIIREEPADRVKLEMALVENVQREDLNALDRAVAFRKLAQEFSLTHKEIGARVGKSREYVANSVRLLTLPVDMQEALKNGHISEGHARPLLMLSDRPQEQKALFEDILYRNLNVREAERISRKIAVERARKKEPVDPVMKSLEDKLRDTLGTRVSIEKRGMGGKISIEFFSEEELREIFAKFLLEGSKEDTRPSDGELKAFSVSVAEPNSMLPNVEPEEDLLPEASQALASDRDVDEFTI